MGAATSKASEHRDRDFLGIHAGEALPLEEGDVYGTLREKVWRGERAFLLSQLAAAKEMFLACLPPSHLPRRPGLNPVAWTVGHVAFTFDSLIADTLHLPKPGSLSTSTARVARADAWTLYDSMRINGDERWGYHDRGALPDAHAYLEAVHRQAEEVVRTCTQADGCCPPVQSYLVLYAIIHELWHTEDCVHTRHTNRLPPPPLAAPPPAEDTATVEAATDVAHEDIAIPGGTYHLGAIRPEAGGTPMVGGGGTKRAPAAKLAFDCEKWEHPVRLRPFRIGKYCVTNAQFAAFVDAGGYADDRYWSHEGLRWRRASGAEHPWTWRRAGEGEEDEGEWRVRWFDSEMPLPRRQPVSHVHWWEAEAYCNWAGRRLPTEAEWEAACCAVAEADGSLSPHKARVFPWGDDQPSHGTANAGLRRATLLDVDDLAGGDSAWGLRQMIGNVWEWTATAFYPFPGYVMDFPYREQSAPWFGFTKVARGGCFATPDLILRGDYRSFYHPSDRPELAVGFRTCALD